MIIFKLTYFLRYPLYLKAGAFLTTICLKLLSIIIFQKTVAIIKYSSILNVNNVFGATCLLCFLEKNILHFLYLKL